MRGYGLTASKPAESPPPKRVIDIRKTIPRKRDTETGRAAYLAESFPKDAKLISRGSDFSDEARDGITLPKEMIPRLAAKTGMHRSIRLGTYREGGRRKHRKTRKQKKTRRRR
jgi:hypothetical protein